MKDLTKDEEEKLNAIMDKLEREALNYYYKRSGAFANAEAWNYDDEFIDIELKYGIQDGEEDSEHTENHKVVRNTMTLTDDY